MSQFQIDELISDIRALTKAVNHMDRDALLHALKLHPSPTSAKVAGAVSIMVLTEAGLMENTGEGGFFKLTEAGVRAARAIEEFGEGDQ